MRWKLPKTFKIAKIKRGSRQRHDGEPRFTRLIKHANDRTLTAAEFQECCGCGLTHHRTFNVVKIRRRWYLIERTYRVPSTTSKKDLR
jgi:hypothetical protein